MKAKYLGVPSKDDDGPRRVGFCGLSFPRSVFIDVSDVPPKLIAKLDANPYFEVSNEALTKDDIAAAEAVNGQAEEDAEPGAPAAHGDKAGVIAALEAMQAKHPEVKFSAKMGVEKLQGILEAAQFEYGDDD